MNKYLEILARQYPDIRRTAAEIVNLQSVLALPKGTEHFLSDIHGEFEQFKHVLKNGSGSVRRKIDEIFGDTVETAAKRTLATLIYYPEEKLELVRQAVPDINNWYAVTINRLVIMARSVTSKYTRSKVRGAIPDEHKFIVEELITEKPEISDKKAYYDKIIQTIISIGWGEEIIVTLANLIQQLVIDHLHITGDIFDRGPGPHVILDTLMQYHSVDIQWGNHDIVWMGAASGQLACIANVIRLCARYGNLEVLEEGYGINLLPLGAFAQRTYQDDPCSAFSLKAGGRYTSEIETKIYKAVSVIQFKLEGQLVLANPEFEMDDRLLLDKIDWNCGTVRIQIEGNEREFPLKDLNFPTLDRQNPYALSEDEERVMAQLKKAFSKSEKLQRHVKFLFAKGSLYKTCNSNLLYHGCVPLNADGSFRPVQVRGAFYSGRELYEVLEQYIRQGYFAPEGSEEREVGRDIMWYMWTGPNSPVYGRDKMTTFERILVEDKAAHKERKDVYYKMDDDEAVVDRILEEFGLNPKTSHIINGHVPVELKKGETPIKCGGKLLIIDGGFSKAYHETTGIAGYTLVSNSRGIRLVSHEKFETTEQAIVNETDIVSDTLTVEVFPERRFVRDTDAGKKIQRDIEDLTELLSAYRKGIL